MTFNIQPLLNKRYPKATRAEGVYIFEESGKKYLDGCSGAVSCSLGHSHPKIIRRIKEQSEQLIYVYRSQFGSQEAEYLAQLICSKSTDHHLSHCFFVNSGSEAMETAIKVALQYWQEQGHAQKHLFITRQKSYHGITLGALSLSGHQHRRARFENVLHDLVALKGDLDAWTLDELIDELEAVIAQVGADRIAAFVAEPIVGAAGTALTPPEGYYGRIRSVCDRHNILFIADEVMTGMGRTGKWYALEHWHTQADIVAIGKSLGAGYAPIAATLMTPDVLHPITKGSGLIMSGHTYSGHPLSCAIAASVLEVIEEDQLLDQVISTGDYLKGQLDSFQARYHFIQKVRGKGLLLGIEFDQAVPESSARCVQHCYESGLLVYPSVGGPDGTSENGILIAPPFIINAEEVDLLLQKLAHSLDKINHA